ncbi:hypothetical protein EMIT0P201_50547 [Pseudomonas chlororaphis]
MVNSAEVSCYSLVKLNDCSS